MRFTRFYEIFDKDAVIINKMLNYKLLKISETVKCGFPNLSLEKVLNFLEEQEINYVVIDDDNIIKSKKFDNNIYDDFKVDVNNIKYNFLRINKIMKYLNNKAYSEIDELLESIEKLINE